MNNKENLSSLDTSLFEPVSKNILEVFRIKLPKFEEYGYLPIINS